MREQRSFCRICAALCGIVVTVDGDQVVGVRGDPDHPFSRGYTCPKGRALPAWHHHPDRLDHPHLRRGGDLVPVDWDACLDDLAAALRGIVDRHGADSVAMYLATATSFDGSGGRVAHGLLSALGSRSRYTALTIDTPCRPMVFDLVAGFPGLLPALDHETTTLSLLIGSNPVVSHGHSHGMPDPVQRLRALAASPKELWVVDPRRTETARLATAHLALRPGTDHVLLAYLLRELLGPDGGADRGYLAEHAEGVERLERAVAPFSLEVAARSCDVPADELRRLLDAIRRHRRLAVQTGTGTTMSRTANVTEWLAVALGVVTHSYEQPGGLWFHPGFLKCLDRRTIKPSSGELYAAGSPGSRPELANRYGEVPCAALADEIEAGNVRALLVIGGNPLSAFPDSDRIRAALGRLEVLAVADVVATETTELATHVLPCAGQLERADVPDYVDQYMLLVASQYTAPVVAPAADRRPLWWAMASLGRRLGVDCLPGGLDPDDCDDDRLLAAYSRRARIAFEELREADGVVVADGPVRGWVEQQVLPGGRWRLAPEPLVAQLAALGTPGADDVVLMPRRQLRAMNSQLRDVSAPGGRPDGALIRINPGDAAAWGIAEGSRVVVSSATGSTAGPVTIDDTLRPGTVSVPHGRREPSVGALTTATGDVDPLTGMVLQSGVAVSVQPEPGGLSR